MTLNKTLLRKSTRGAALVEYGILVGLIAVGAIAAVISLGEEVDTTFSTVGTALATNLSTAQAGGTPAPALDEQMSFTMTAGEVGGGNTWYGYREGVFGSISGDFTMHFGDLTMMEWESDQVPPRTYLSFNGSTPSLLVGAVMDCGADGTVVFDNADFQSGMTYGFDGDILSINNGDVISCTMTL